VKGTTTNIIKGWQIHFHLFQIKLNVLLAPLPGHFTMKVQNIQEAMEYHLAKMHPQSF